MNKATNALSFTPHSFLRFLLGSDVGIILLAIISMDEETISQKPLHWARLQVDWASRAMLGKVYIRQRWAVSDVWHALASMPHVDVSKAQVVGCIQDRKHP